jgi:osmotically-inducible protein OsmY
MTARGEERFDQAEWIGMRNRFGEHGLEPDFGGVGTTPRYRGGSWVDQRVDQRGAFTGRGPKGYVRSDERIFEDVCERLTLSGDVDASDIDVSVERGEVTLNGTVATRSQKGAAEAVVDAASGVVDVHNHLRLGNSGRAER